MLLAREERNWIFPSPSKINGGRVKKKKKVLCLSSREGRTVAVSNSDLGGRGGGDGGEVGSVAVMSSNGLVLTVFQWSKLGFERFIATGHSGGMGECGGTSGKGTVVADK
jgi:hypothetical protein